MKELEINGVFDLSESNLSADEFEKKLIQFIESLNVYFGGSFYELNDDGEKI